MAFARPQDRRIPHAESLDQERYGVLLRGIRTSVELFREENVPIQTELALLDQKYSQIDRSDDLRVRGRDADHAPDGALPRGPGPRDRERAADDR